MRSPDELRQNRAQAILHIRSGRATSRRTLADVMALSPTTSGFYVDELISSGYIQETGLEQSGKGRPKRSLSTRADAGWFAGVEFNAERIQAVRVDFSGRLTDSNLRPLPEGANTAAILKEVRRAVSALRKDESSPLLGIGVGAPGIVDPDLGLGRDYAFVSDWKNVSVAKTLRSSFGVNVTLENNLRAIAIAERWFGGGRDLDDYVVVGPRSGFGIAIVHGGRLFGGTNHAAGEIGRWPWRLGKQTCELHDELSSIAVWRRLAGASSRSKLPSNFHTALSKFADTSSMARDSVVHDFAHVLGCLHLLLDSSAYLLHGPLTALGTKFCDEIVAQVAKMIPMLSTRLPRFVPSQLGDDAGALGTAGLAMEHWEPTSSDR
ncbi:ROK family protein [Verrucomicrobiota bacterium sgz303538]